MFGNFIKFIATGIISLGLLIGSHFGVHLPQNEGAAIPKPVAFFQDSLASGIGTADTSMTLVSGLDQQGNNLTGFIGFVIDEGTASQEVVVGTASGTSITSMTRGIDPVTGQNSVTALEFTHRRGASVKITTSPVLLVMYQIMNGLTGFPNAIKYDNNPVFTGAASTTVASKGYVDNTAFSGAPDSAQGVKGLVEGATQAQCAAGTATGVTTAPLSCPTKYFNATQSATTTIPVTGTNGKLSQNFLDLTQPFTFTNPVTLASTTINNNFSITSASTTINGATNTFIVAASSTFAITPTITNQPVNGGDAANKSYVDTIKLTTIAVNNQNEASTTITISAGQSVYGNCAMNVGGNNTAETFHLESEASLGSLTADLPINYPTGTDGGFSLTNWFTGLSAGSHTFRVVRTSGTAGSGGGCIYQIYTSN